MFTAIILCSLTAPVDPPKEKEFTAEARRELKKFEGRWKLTKVAGGGKEVDWDKEVSVEFKESAMTITAGDKVESYQIAAIDTGTNPRCIDLLEKRKGKPDRTLEGVYRFDGDTLQIAHELPSNTKNRPTGFEKSVNGALVLTLKRVKE